MALKESNSEDVHMSSVSASAHYLRTSFGLTDDVLNQIHTEVTAVLRTLALERKDVLSTKAAVTFTSTLLDDLLDQSDVADREDDSTSLPSDDSHLEFSSSLHIMFLS
ncbi:hypothetical protein AOLI_G00323330 [Acnodon oligacanthus]